MLVFIPCRESIQYTNWVYSSFPNQTYNMPSTSNSIHMHRLPPRTNRALRTIRPMRPAHPPIPPHRLRTSAYTHHISVRLSQPHYIFLAKHQEHQTSSRSKSRRVRGSHLWHCHHQPGQVGTMSALGSA